MRTDPCASEGRRRRDERLNKGDRLRWQNTHGLWIKGRVLERVPPGSDPNELAAPYITAGTHRRNAPFGRSRGLGPRILVEVEGPGPRSLPVIVVRRVSSVSFG